MKSLNESLNKDLIKNFLINIGFLPSYDEGEIMRYTDRMNEIHLTEDSSLEVPYSTGINVDRYNIYLTKNEKLIYSVDVKNDNHNDVENFKTIITKIIQLQTSLKNVQFEACFAESDDHFVHPDYDLDARFTCNAQTFKLEVTIIQSIYKKTYTLCGTEQDKQTLDNIILDNQSNLGEKYLIGGEQSNQLFNSDVIEPFKNMGIDLNKLGA